jgi:hypothetical protein
MLSGRHQVNPVGGRGKGGKDAKRTRMRQEVVGGKKWLGLLGVRRQFVEYGSISDCGHNVLEGVLAEFFSGDATYRELNNEIKEEKN